MTLSLKQISLRLYNSRKWLLRLNGQVVALSRRRCWVQVPQELYGQVANRQTHRTVNPTVHNHSGIDTHPVHLSVLGVIGNRAVSKTVRYGFKSCRTCLKPFSLFGRASDSESEGDRFKSCNGCGLWCNWQHMGFWFPQFRFKSE